MHLVLTSSNESVGHINDAWSVLLKRIRRKWQKFEYFKIRTDEGVKGVLHIVCRNSEFITKEWLSSNWSDTFQATVTWSTQAYGHKRGITKYLMGYLQHHESFRYGYSKFWLFVGWRKAFRLIFDWKNPLPYVEKIDRWEKILYTKPPDSYPVRGQKKLNAYV